MDFLNSSLSHEYDSFAGRNIGPEEVEYFHIVITDISEMSTTTDAFLLISPDRTMTTQGTVGVERILDIISLLIYLF